jgi:trehalose utilization protein
MTNLPRVTIWNEYRHEREHAQIAELYPEGIHGAIANHLISQGFPTRTATLDEPEHGLTDEVLADTDVLFWWGHKAHGQVSDEVVEKIFRRVTEGMGFVALHSAHESKVFKRLLGTSGALTWREASEKERIWVVDPGHPIADGLDEYFELPKTEMYGEPFDIPKPDALVFISWFQGGEVFRSGCCFSRGRGKIFYFRPGHETFPIYHDINVQRVLANAAKWATPTGTKTVFRYWMCGRGWHRPEPLVDIEGVRDLEIEHPEYF